MGNVLQDTGGNTLKVLAGGGYGSVGDGISGWTINMDMNSGTLETRVQDYVDASQPAFTEAAGRTYYSDGDGVATPFGSRCARMTLDPADQFEADGTTEKGGWGQWGGVVNFSTIGVAEPAKGDEVWVSMKMFMPAGFNYQASPDMKFMRLRANNGSDVFEGYNDWYFTPDDGGWDFVDGSNQSFPFWFIKETTQNVKHYFGANDTLGTANSVDRPVRGTWETYEMYLKLDESSVDLGGTSRVRVWKNDKLLVDATDIETLGTATSYLTRFHIFTYFNGGIPSPAQSLYVDDLIITTTPPTNTDASGNLRIKDLV